jgi:hypothetical protein
VLRQIKKSEFETNLRTKTSSRFVATESRRSGFKKLQELKNKITDRRRIQKGTVSWRNERQITFGADLSPA